MDIDSISSQLPNHQAKLKSSSVLIDQCS